MVIVLILYLVGAIGLALVIYDDIFKGDDDVTIATRHFIFVIATLLWPITLYFEITNRRKRRMKHSGAYVSIHTWDDMRKISKHKSSNTEIIFRNRVAWTHVMESYMPESRVIRVIDGVWKVKDGLTLEVPNEVIKDSGPLVLYKLLRSN